MFPQRCSIARPARPTRRSSISTAGRIVTWNEHPTKAHPYGQPPITIEEVFKVGDIVKADAGWRARHEAAQPEQPRTSSWCRSIRFRPDISSARSRKAGASSARSPIGASDIKDNGYAHPIEGVVALVDLIECKVVHLVDEPDIVPIPKDSETTIARRSGRVRTNIKPLDIVQPEGPSFAVEGWKVVLAELVVPCRIDRARRAGAPPDRLSRRQARAADHLSRQRHRHGGALRRSDRQPFLEERVRCRRIRARQARERAGARLRLSRPHPLFRRAGRRRLRQADAS